MFDTEMKIEKTAEGWIKYQPSAVRLVWKANVGCFSILKGKYERSYLKQCFIKYEDFYIPHRYLL